MSLPRRIAGWSLGAWLLLGSVACNRSHSQPRTNPAVIDAPTVVMISVDTLRADRLGCYGKAEAGTPSLDRLAVSGARFTRAESAAVLTLPAHTSLLSGRTLPAHRVFNNGTFQVPASVPLVSESFRRAGYATGAFVSSPVLAQRYGLSRGFDRYDDQIARPSGAQKGLVVHYDERSGRETVTRALAWVEGLGSKPAFLWIHLWEPHAPYTPPSEFSARADGDRYQGEVAAADHAIGRLIDGLGTLGRRQRLLVSVTADHGEGLGDHHEPTHGLFLYRETMGIPWIIQGSDFAIQPRVIETPASIADIAPTVLELAGLPALTGADGVSFASLLRGQGAAPERAGVTGESHLPQIEFGWSGLRALVSPQGQRLIDSPAPELYDEASDPAAARDLAATRRSEVSALQRQLEALVAAASARAPSEDTAAAIDPEELARLQALGYAGTAQRRSDTPLIDRRGVHPRTRAEFVQKFDLASARTRENRHAEALALYAELERIEPTNPGLLLQHGQALILSERFELAEKKLRQALKVSPDYGLAWYRLGQLLDHTKRYEDAEAAYRQGIHVEPMLLDLRKALVGLLLDRGRSGEAIVELETLKELDPHDPAVTRDLERIWAKSKKK
jgi:arylsulfatase A-like enzyme